MRQRWIVIVVCLLLAVARFLLPTLKIDTIFISLVLIGVLTFFVPKLIPYVKRIKYGQVEVELRDFDNKVARRLEQHTEAAKKYTDLISSSGEQSSIKPAAVDIQRALDEAFIVGLMLAGQFKGKSLENINNVKVYIDQDGIKNIQWDEI